MHSLSAILTDFKSSLTGERVSVDAILEAFHERGFGFLLFIFALPAALPFPAVGIGTVFAPALLVLTAQQAAGRHTVWLPRRVRTMTVNRAFLIALLDKGMPWIRRVEYLIRPRIEFATQGFFSHLAGVLGFIMAVSVLLPVPLTNTVPSFGIALMAVGVIMRDGLAVLAGAVIGTGWVLMLCLIVTFLGAEGLEIFKATVKSFL